MKTMNDKSKEIKNWCDDNNCCLDIMNDVAGQEDYRQISGSLAFKYTGKVLRVPSGVHKIATGAFYSGTWDRLEEIYLPATIHDIGEYIVRPNVVVHVNTASPVFDILNDDMYKKYRIRIWTDSEVDDSTLESALNKMRVLFHALNNTTKELKEVLSDVNLYKQVICRSIKETLNNAGKLMSKRAASYRDSTNEEDREHIIKINEDLMIIINATHDIITKLSEYSILLDEQYSWNIDSFTYLDIIRYMEIINEPNQTEDSQQEAKRIYKTTTCSYDERFLKRVYSIHLKEVKILRNIADAKSNIMSIE
jgi:hypothetical protein